MSLRQFSTLAALMGATSAAGVPYTYNVDNGGVGPDSDWALIVTDNDGNTVENHCAKTNQSPIALFSKGKPGFDYSVFESSKDNIKKSYTNQYNTVVANTGDTTKVTLATDATDGLHDTNWFESDIADLVFGSVNKRWEGA